MPEPFVEGIAIIGAVGRFPGARNLTQFWSNLCAGRESVSAFTDAQLAESGFDPVQLRADSRYVPVRGTVDEAEWFDAPFFGFTPRQALFTDPQQRLFLEAAWEALEVAGCDPSRTKRSIGVFAGCGNNSWARRYLNRDLDELESNDWLESAIGNEKDYVATRVAYKLNLRGPAVSINTACSTSLVAICQACQALWTYQCDVAIAGGVNISFPQHRGYYHDDEGISSPDGHTRAFDAEARGTVFSNGLGIVVLKRLSEAMEDGDEIVAVIRGAALNNDGSGKASFTAPSADGQAEVIALAQQMAGVAPESVSYVETHGTATPIGDVIELAGLTKAFRLGTSKKQFCAIGSVKSNIGHLEHAAGVAGLIKTALALKQRVLPPSLFYSRPNPNIDFADSPFVVNATLRDWEGPTPRRAGVSSFGVGGTNAHVVLEEAPSRPASGPSRPVHVLPLSAKSEAALQQASLELADFLRSHPDVPLADVAFTLQRGRAALDVRRAIVARSASEAAQSLAGDAPARSLPVERALDRQLIFMFPGGGAQYAGAARGLCEALPEFERWIMECLGTLDATVSTTVDRLIRVAAADMTDADHQLAEQPSIGLPMLFAVEYAVAQYFLARGSTPTALIGHSLGEYAAACVSGVMSLDDAMALVQLRGRLFDELPAGAMVNVAADVERCVWARAQD
jgi:acyl transferase domain-containing protein